MGVHPTAVIDDTAELAPDVDVGAYAVVGAGVSLGAGCVLHSHAIVMGPARLGKGNVVHPFAVLGGAPQDVRAPGDPGSLVIGARNVFREHVTVHRGTSGRATTIGDANLFMVGTHLAHDVAIGTNVTCANGVMLAGHVVVEDHVTFGGAAAIAQHLRVGESAFVAGGAMVERDVPPFVVMQGDRARVRALNKVGLRRRGFDETTIDRLERALRNLMFGEGALGDRIAALVADEQDARIAALARAFTFRDR